MTSAGTPVTKETPEPETMLLEMTSPTFPALALSLVAVPIMPLVVGENARLVAVAMPNDSEVCRTSLEMSAPALTLETRKIEAIVAPIAVTVDHPVKRPSSQSVASDIEHFENFIRSNDNDVIDFIDFVEEEQQNGNQENDNAVNVINFVNGPQPIPVMLPPEIPEDAQLMGDEHTVRVLVVDSSLIQCKVMERKLSAVAEILGVGSGVCNRPIMSSTR